MAEHVLVIEGEPIVRSTVARLLIREGFEVHVAENAAQALAMSPHLPELVVLVADAGLAGAVGQEALRHLKSKHPRVRAIMLADAHTTGGGRRHLAREEAAGRMRGLDLDGCLVKPFDMGQLLAAINQLSAGSRVERERGTMLERLRRNVVTMVDSLAQALEARDPYTHGHSLRVASLSMMIAETLGLSELELTVLHHGAALHDIGKIAVRQEILHKPGKLTNEEFEHIKVHPVVGREILEPIEDFKAMLDLVYYHHERIDGKGYPEGLTGDDIPVLAQIVAVADTYDAMTSDRPYRQGMPPEKALMIMREVAGTQLNAEFVAILSHQIRSRAEATCDPSFPLFRNRT